jgi:hypothetical protein
MGRSTLAYGSVRTLLQERFETHVKIMIIGTILSLFCPYAQRLPNQPRKIMRRLLQDVALALVRPK